MKRLLALMLCAVSLGAAAQIEFPFNPDSNGDGEIGVDDLLGMLSGFGESWTLPDENLWASSTIQNLLAFEQELDSLSSVLVNQQEVLDSTAAVLDSAVQLAFCTEQLTSWNELKGDCFIYMGEASGQAYYVPADCFHVNVSMSYGCNCCSFQTPIRLPSQGLFLGQVIDFTLLRQGGCMQGGISIEQFVNQNWEEVTSLFDYTTNNTSHYNTNFTHETTNRRLIWDGSQWVLQWFPPHQIYPSPSPANE